MCGFRRSAWINVCPGARDAGTCASVFVFLCWCQRQEVLAMSKKVLARPGEVLAWLAGWLAGIECMLKGVLATLEGHAPDAGKGCS